MVEGYNVVVVNIRRVELLQQPRCLKSFWDDPEVRVRLAANLVPLQGSKVRGDVPVFVRKCVRVIFEKKRSGDRGKDLACRRKRYEILGSKQGAYFMQYFEWDRRPERLRDRDLKEEIELEISDSYVFPEDS